MRGSPHGTQGSVRGSPHGTQGSVRGSPHGTQGSVRFQQRARGRKLIVQVGKPSW